MTTERILDDIIRREGGYVNHASDRGGPTKYGITLATLSDWRGKPQTADDVRALTEAEARNIYQQRYIIEPGYEAIADAALRALVVDCAVNHGPRRATRFLQAALGVTERGLMDGDTRAALATADAGKVWRKVLGIRIRFYGSLIRNDPSQSVFAAGWANRCAEFLES